MECMECMDNALGDGEGDGDMPPFGPEPAPPIPMSECDEVVNPATSSSQTISKRIPEGSIKQQTYSVHKSKQEREIEIEIEREQK